MSTDIDIDDSSKTAAAPEPRKPRQAKAGGMVRIVVPKTERNVSDVYVNANFRAYQIKRGVEVDVPQAVCDALDNARETRYFEESGPDGRKHMVAQEVLSYPYQRVG